MLNRQNGQQELDRVNMFIRALSDEMAQAKTQTDSERNALEVEMEEALYELRLRKLLISALFDSDQITNKTTSH
jgi:hypothetical protein